MVALARDGEYLAARHLSPEIAAISPNATPAMQSGGFTLEGDTLKQKVESLEKTLVKEALARHRWNQSKVARELGLSRVGLTNKIRRYELQGMQ